MQSPDNLIELISQIPAFSHRKWVECKIKDSAKKLIALDAVESYEQLIKEEFIQANELSKILLAVKHSSTVVADVGALCLMDLANKHRIVFDVLRELSSSKKSNDRLLVIAYLRCGFPRDFMLEIVSSGLIDKSSRVRLQAADACAGIGLIELLPLMEERLQVEDNPDVVEALRHHGAVLKDGYYLHYPGGRPWLAVKKSNGERIIVGLKQEQIDNEGLSAIVERIKNQP